MDVTAMPVTGMEVETDLLEGATGMVAPLTVTLRMGTVRRKATIGMLDRGGLVVVEVTGMEVVVVDPHGMREEGTGRGPGLMIGLAGEDVHLLMMIATDVPVSCY